MSNYQSYYKESSIGLFPSNNIKKSNSRITNEENVSALLRSLGVKSHIISGLEVTIVDDMINISDGSAFINGFLFTTTEDLVMDMPSLGTYYLYIVLKYDINNHVTGTNAEGFVEGISVELSESSKEDYNWFLLGTLNDGVFNKDFESDIIIDGGDWDRA